MPDRVAFHVLLSLVRLRRNAAPTDDLRRMLATGVDWPRVFMLGRRHRVLALAASQALASDMALPPDVRDGLSTYLARNTQRNLAKLAELGRLVGLLDARGIGCIPFRGPTLAGLAYDTLGEREFADLDIIVARTHMIAAADRLCENGYTHASATQPEQLRRIVEGQHAVPLVRGSDGLRVELHWTVSPRYMQATRSFDDLWPHVHRVEVAGMPVPTLAARALLPALCEHGAKHFWDRLAWIVDLDGVVHSTGNPPWTDWEQVARRAGQLRALQLGLDLAGRVLGTSLEDLPASLRPPRRIERISREAAARLPFPERPLGPLARAHVGWTIHDRLIDRLRYIRDGVTTLTPADQAGPGWRPYVRRVRRVLSPPKT